MRFFPIPPTFFLLALVSKQYFLFFLYYLFFLSRILKIRPLPSRTLTLPLPPPSITHTFSRVVKRLKACKHEDSNVFSASINHIIRHNFMSLDILAVTLEIEAKREKKNQPARTRYPPEHLNRKDQEWHDAKYSTILNHVQRTPYLPPIGRLYNGFPLRFKGERSIYLVHNDSLHMFPSWQTFCDMGFDLGRRLMKHHTAPPFSHIIYTIFSKQRKFKLLPPI